MNYLGRNLESLISHIFQLVVVQLLFGKLHAQFNLELSVTEESPPNTLIGNLHNLSPVKGLTESYSTTSSTFQLLSQTTLFWLNDTSGELFTRVPIDRESVCSETHSTLGRINKPEKPLSSLSFETRLSDFPDESVCRIQLQVLHFTQGSLSTQEDSQSHRVIILGITILDINDNPPSWYENAIHISIPEHSPIGSRFPLPAAFDPDCGLMNTTVSYSLWDSANRRELGTEYTSQYDHDAFQLDTETIPNSNSAEYGHALWNGHSVMCTRRSFKLWLRIVRDLDYDVTPNLLTGRRNYHSGSLHMRQFQLQLRATDGGQPVALTGTVVLNINVTDINDHEPVFKLRRSKQKEGESKPPTNQVQPEEEVIQVEENSSVGRIIYTAQATDVDELDNSRLSYSLGTSASSLVRSMFEINAKSGEVSLHQSPDFEQYKSFSVPLTVTDGKHRASLNLLVLIINQNDHQPVITVQPVGQPRREDNNFSTQKSPSSVKTHFGHPKSVKLYITEHEPPGRFIATVTVTDVDDAASQDNAPALKSHSQTSTYQGGYAYLSKDTDSAIRCQISHTGFGLSPLFEGAVNQYKLLTKTTFDREQQSEQFATLTCFDRGQPPLSTQLGLHILIEDINDHVPVFKHNRMVVDFKENEPVGTKVYVVEATDPDWGLNAQLGFNLAPEDTNDFIIDPISGVVTSLRSFDREQQSHFNLTVFVKDHVDYTKHTNVSPYHNSVTVTSAPYQSEDLNNIGGHVIKGNLIVHIQDVNDCPPVFANSLYQLSVSEDAKINLLIGQIKANDSDATETNNQVSWPLDYEVE
ncbi:Cadherin domain protein [Paragonimus heterotremus]|uniref:Cadherin domain protein n=1 Tax=Paragonimus heterotremus TaxID=100268 RepID=A0A8J4TNM7_9TREM|nr:Cadherin domain protein [Paragonimus heterotremus]